MPSSRTIAAQLFRLLDELARPVCIFDEERRLVFANTACTGWAGVEIDRLVGQTASFTSVGQSDDSATVNRLCPPPEAFAGRRQSGLVYSVDDEGALVRRQAEFLPLDPGAAPSPVLVICEMADLVDEVNESRDLATPSADGCDDDTKRLHERIAPFRHTQRGRFSLERLIGDSPAMQLARAQVRAAIASRSNVVVIGPAGSGRQWVARAIHYNALSNQSSSGDEPLVTLDGAVLTEELLSSAVGALAAGGRSAQATVLILNLDQLSQEIQADLLRACLQRFPKLRVLATSQHAPDALVSDGRLLPQLAAAAGTLVIRLPPLADRRQDIPLLAQLLVEELNAEGGKQLRGVAPDTLDALVAYSWLGNVDELARFLREAFEHAKGTEITSADLPRRLAQAALAARLSRPVAEPIVLEEFLAGIERELIRRALKQARGNKAHAARLLGLTRPRLYRRMVQLGLVSEPSIPAPDTADGRAAAANGKGEKRPSRKAVIRTNVEPDAEGPAEIEEEAEFIEDIPFEEQAGS